MVLLDSGHTELLSIRNTVLELDAPRFESGLCHSLAGGFSSGASSGLL